MTALLKGMENGPLEHVLNRAQGKFLTHFSFFMLQIQLRMVAQVSFSFYEEIRGTLSQHKQLKSAATF